MDLVYKELEILWFFLPKIFVATICGLIIGYDREIRNKVAGIRTNVLIIVGCTILTTSSLWLSKDGDSDPSRILGQIVTGIGFLGGGVIMKTDDKIVGVTTAAFIWIASAIGIMIGLDIYLIPIIITLGLIVISNILERIEKRLKNKRESKNS